MFTRIRVAGLVSGLICGALAAGCSAPARRGPHGPATSACGTPATCEQRAGDRLEAARSDPAALARLLQQFPKGGDLHNHMAGSVYAESYLAWAREDGFRVDATLKLIEAAKCTPGACSELPAQPGDPKRTAVIRAWSMQDFAPAAGGHGETGHDHFFAAFTKFGGVSHEVAREPAMLAETMRRAADDGAIYLETLVTVARPLINDIAKAAGAPDPADLAGFERKLRADPRWAELIASSRAGLVDRDHQARALMRCGAVDSAPACSITVRYIAQVGRTSPPGRILAEMLAAFEISALEPMLAGVNLVSPEDNATALKDYDLQMAIIGMLADEFRGKSPARVTLHAGELTPAIAPATGLASHVRNAVEHAHAERIGHAVDILGETDAPGLLAELRARGVTVEVCLSSNAFILGVAGAAHPLAALLAAGVPVAIATDDAGVSRSSLTGELVRAVTVQGVRYPQLKAMARASVTGAFVPGASLWAPPAATAAAGAAPTLIDACAAGASGKPAPACAAFLAGSERAQLQWKLEQQLAAFEAE